MKSILDPSFKYRSSVNTDLRRTFARIRREQHRAKIERQGTPQSNTLPMPMFRARKPAND